MTAKQKLARLCTLLGCGCVLVAALLLVHNAWVERNAAQATATALAAIALQAEPANPSSAANGTQTSTDNTQADETTHGSETLSVAEKVYCGVLAIDALGLALPIQAEFSYPNLQSSPCIYTQEGNQALTIAAHNYAAHFGNLPQLQVGDVVCYTPLGADAQYYTVTAQSTVEENDWQAVEGTAEELILFTCNINNNNQRVVVRCTLQSAAIGTP